MPALLLGCVCGAAAACAAVALARRSIVWFCAEAGAPPPKASGRHLAAAALGLGALAAMLACRHGPGPYAAAVLCALALLLALSLVDAALGLLPDALTGPLLWLGLLRAWAGGDVGPVPLHDAVAGAVCGYGLPWLLAWVYARCCGRVGMGRGDLKLLAALGAWLGPGPLPGLLLAACVAGLAWACLWRRDFRGQASYPFGPFLAGAGAVALLLGPEVHWGFA
ncbi:prepilin peptidase [Candidimonas nitroreducens]|uniref:prepilin peptidase n=1 Tax=Candidimonas nitroreducens TaxID=683354 RepID=UPI0011787BD4|nr:A24 family peptidase [Candidimonas nitroreducens]